MCVSTEHSKAHWPGRKRYTLLCSPFLAHLKINTGVITSQQDWKSETGVTAAVVTACGSPRSHIPSDTPRGSAVLRYNHLLLLCVSGCWPNKLHIC